MNRDNSVPPERSRRARKTLSPHELECFLGHLAATGNFALACDRLGRAKSGLYKRRARDPVFAAQCQGARARFKSSPSSPGGGGGGPPKAMERSAATILSTHAGRPQLRRAAPGTLTAAGVETFLETLALTGNVRFAAASVGVAPSSIHYRRRRDTIFAWRIDQAIDASLHALEIRLLERTLAYLEYPSPLAGEDGLATGEPGEGEAVVAPRGDLPNLQITGPVSFAEALRLLVLSRRAFAKATPLRHPRPSRSGRRGGVDYGRGGMTDEQVKDQLVRSLVAFSRRVIKGQE